MRVTTVEQEIEKVKKGFTDELNLAGFGLKEIPEEVYELNTIKKLIIGYWQPHYNQNCIKKLSDKLIQLEKLETLNLQGNLLSKLPTNLWQLKKLKYLYLENNNLTEFPSEIAMLPNLQYVCLTGNPILMPPPEISFKGIGAIKNYYTKLNKGIDVLYELKLILVGEGRVGKTSITRSLLSQDYQLIDEKSTEGISIDCWNLKKEQLKLSHDYKINIWDFGGQEIYHSTHQFFLTKRSIYLLVSESRKEDSNDIFYYWLNLIKILGRESPVIIVLNKCDQPTKDLPLKEYKTAFSNIIDFVKISCLPSYKDTIDNLKQKIKVVLENSRYLPHIGTPLPKSWIDIRKELEKKKEEGFNYISLFDYYVICKSFGQDESSADFLSAFFHDLGVFLHFADDIMLRDTIFLNHEWVTYGVYKILDNKTVISNFGKFTEKDLISVWNEAPFKFKQGHLLALMNKFELSVKLNAETFLAPQLLPVDKVSFDLSSATDSADVTNYEFRYEFMPKGILARLIVKVHYLIYDNIYWRYGLVLKYENTFAIVQEKFFERKISIQVSGSYKRDLLTIIRTNIKEINNSFSNLSFQEMIPCNCIQCKQDLTPYFFNAENLNRRLSRGIYSIECDRSLDRVNIHGLLGEIIKFEEGPRGEIIYNFYAPISVDTGIFGDNGKTFKQIGK